MQALIEFLRDRLIPERVRRRRRVEAIARHWALHLWALHGYEGALAKCRQRIAFCDRRGLGVRRGLWRQALARLESMKDCKSFQ